MGERRTKYGKAILEFNAALFAIYASLPGSCPEDVRRAIALAICLPGFRKAAMSERRPLTLLLPISGDVTGILETIYALGDPQRILRLLLMHAWPGRLLLKKDRPIGSFSSKFRGNRHIDRDFA